MAKRKYGSAVVMRGRDVIGIFTTVDACRALASLLHERAPDSGVEIEGRVHHHDS